MTTHQLSHRRPAQAIGLSSFFAIFTDAAAARRQRRALKHLDDAMLKDIGITRAEALAESRRPAWDVPAHWRC